MKSPAQHVTEQVIDPSGLFPGLFGVAVIAFLHPHFRCGQCRQPLHEIGDPLPVLQGSHFFSFGHDQIGIIAFTAVEGTSFFCRPVASFPQPRIQFADLPLCQPAPERAFIEHFKAGISCQSRFTFRALPRGRVALLFFEPRQLVIEAADVFRFG